MIDEDHVQRVIDRVSAEIERHRKEQNFSYDNLAMLVGTTKSTVFAIGNKKAVPNFATLIKVCMALDIKLSEVLKTEDL